MSSSTLQQNFYTVGGTVQAGDGIYLFRPADDQLMDLCRAGAFAYILTARQMGKSSLVIQAAEQLAQEGIEPVYIDLTKIGGGKDVTSEQWYLGLLALIERRLNLRTDVVQWWKDRSHLSYSQRFTDFVEAVLLKEITERVVIFIDEIDSTLNLDFTDDFFAAIRHLYNARASTPKLKRLSFVLIGVVTPGDLIRDSQRTPFNIGQRVDATDFTFEEVRPLADGLKLPPDNAQQAVGWILKWTGGHPYLTQRLCKALAETRRAHWSENDVDRLVASVFFGEISEQDNNLQFVRDMLTQRIPDSVEAGKVLETYRQIRRGREILDDEQSLVKSHLKLSGVVRNENKRLLVRNRIYEEVFNDRWIKEHSPGSWHKLARWRERYCLLW